MRAQIIGAVAALLLTSPAAAQQRTNIFRDCLRNQEVGQHPKSKQPDAKFLYVTSVMHETADGGYGSTVGWTVKGTMKEACEHAITEAAQENAKDRGRSISSAMAMLVPDTILQEGLAH